jgi:hypothetical protein
MIRQRETTGPDFLVDPLRIAARLLAHWSEPRGYALDRDAFEAG